MDHIPDPYFSGQIALALAIAETGVRSCALPMRYNFANDERADARYPEELDTVCIFHYLRTDNFDRHKIFASPSAYHQFLELPLAGSNEVFQSYVSTLIGSEYPFAISSEPVSAAGEVAGALPKMAPAPREPSVPRQPPGQQRDISADDLSAALAASDRADLLRELVNISRAAFGFFVDQFTYTINYPWVAARLEDLPAGSRVLDVGAGVSQMPLWLANRGVLVDSVDNHPIAALSRPRRTGTDGAVSTTGSCTRMWRRTVTGIAEFEPVYRFDAIYSVCVLAHIACSGRS